MVVKILWKPYDVMMNYQFNINLSSCFFFSCLVPNFSNSLAENDGEFPVQLVIWRELLEMYTISNL